MRRNSLLLTVILLWGGWLFIVIQPSTAFAQLQNSVWCLGDSTGLQFHPDGAVSYINSISQSWSRADASICDKNGNLKFYYATTQLVDDSSFIVNPNQPGLLSQNKILSDFYYPGLVLPVNDSVYLFLCQYYKNNSQSSVHYYLNIVYVNNNNFYISKNKLITAGPYSDNYTAVKHSNGKDWWFIVHGLNNNNYETYLIQDTTISFSHSQSIGSVHLDGFSKIGYYHYSVSGDKFSCVRWSGILDVFDFDRCTGLLSNWAYYGRTQLIPNYSLQTFPGVFIDCIFSFDTKYIYISAVDTLFQYHLIPASSSYQKKILWYDTLHIHYLANSLLKMNFINKKIYLTHPRQNSVGSTLDYSNNNKYLGVIHSPDSLGEACNYQYFGQYLNGKRVSIALGNSVNYNLGAQGAAYAYRQNGQTAPDSICPGDSVQLGEWFKEPNITYQWQPAAGLSCATCYNPVAKPVVTTTYTLITTNANGCGLTSDTATVTVPVRTVCGGGLFNATIKVYLEGCYNPTGDSLKNDLTDFGLTPQNQPYYAPPFNYAGTENFVAGFPFYGVDWVLVELRDPANPATVVARSAALLSTQGEVAVKFPAPLGSYMLTVSHRNHLTIGYQTPVNVADVADYDLTAPANLAGDANFYATLPNGKVAMLAADGSADRYLTAADYGLWEVANSGVFLYHPADYNLDGFITVGDYFLWVKNNGRFSYFAD